MTEAQDKINLLSVTSDDMQLINISFAKAFTSIRYIACEHAVSRVFHILLVSPIFIITVSPRACSQASRYRGFQNFVKVKLQLHDAIYRLRFYSNSLIHILSLSNSYNNVASLQKNRGDKSHSVIAALDSLVTSDFDTETDRPETVLT